MRLFWSVFRTGLPFALIVGTLAGLQAQPARAIPPAPVAARATAATTRPVRIVPQTTGTPATTATTTHRPPPTRPPVRNTATAATTPPTPGPRVTLSECDQLKIAWDKIAQRNVDTLLKPPYELTPEQEAKESRAYDLWVSC